jgi:hypothetical protein
MAHVTSSQIVDFIGNNEMATGKRIFPTRKR